MAQESSGLPDSDCCDCSPEEPIMVDGSLTGAVVISPVIGHTNKSLLLHVTMQYTEIPIIHDVKLMIITTS